MDFVFETIFKLAQNPIFIVGYPRSGTTLLQALLCTQDNIRSFPETHFFTLVAKLIRIDEQGCIESGCLPQVLKTVEEQMDLKIAGAAGSQIAAAAERHQLTLKSLFELIVWQYLRADPEARWLEKTPDHVRHLDKVMMLYPEARFINIIRHPTYAVQSNKRTPLSRTRSMVWLAEAWNDSIAAYERFRAAHPDKVYSVRYEDLVRDPVRVMAGICAFLEMELVPERLANYRQASENLILTRESWKANVRTNDIANTNGNYPVSLRDALAIQNVTRSALRRYGYVPLYRGCQVMYDAAIALRTRASRVKRSIQGGKPVPTGSRI